MSLRPIARNLVSNLWTAQGVRQFSLCHALLEKPLPPRLVIPETDIEESFLKGSGPGGQKINKTSSAVQLKHVPTGIVVKCQETRSRAQNRKLARHLLSERLDEMEKGPQSRTAIKIERARKKKASASKKARRKYRKLDGDKAADASADEENDIGQDDSESLDGADAHDEQPNSVSVPQQKLP